MDDLDETRADVLAHDNDSNEALSYVSASTLLALFRKRRLTPVAVLKAQIARIEALNPKIEAITYKHFDEALAAAHASTLRYEAGNPRPLEGITIAIKDEFAVEGWLTTMGSLRERTGPEAADCPIVQRLRAAGAVFHVQTTVPEYYMWMATVTRRWGVTRNPWNPAFTPGGSSGGAGAALAAGFTTLALGSDMVGSIRIPASLCGLYGFKAPFGRIPSSEAPYETAGPLARTFDDLARFTDALAGPHPQVQASMRPAPRFTSDYAPVAGWRVAYDPMRGISVLDGAVRQAMDRAMEQLRMLGVVVETVDLGYEAAHLREFLVGLYSTSVSSVGRGALDEAEILTPYARAFFQDLRGQTGPDATIALDALLKDYHARAQQRVFGQGYRALLTPTLASALIPAAHGMNPATDGVMIGGELSQPGTEVVMTWPWNLLNRYPVVSVPVAIGVAGMPIGMQIIANTDEDLDAFQLAAAYSRTAPPFFAGTRFPTFVTQAVE